MPDLEPEEVGAIPEVATLPEGARILEVHSWGTYDGTRFDGMDPSALHDCFFVVPQTFAQVGQWLEGKLADLGWPEGHTLPVTPAGRSGLPRREWARGEEGVELIDFSESTWARFPKPGAGCSMLRLNYWRKPQRAFSSDAEYQAWFNDGPGKGSRWRQRSGA